MNCVKNVDVRWIVCICEFVIPMFFTLFMSINIQETCALSDVTVVNGGW